MNERASHGSSSTGAAEPSTRSAPDPDLSRSRLIRVHQSLVRSLAWQIHQRLPSHVEIDDLIADGQLGLVQAARDFDATRRVRFTTYAFYRIRGAILDGLSKRSWFSRAEYHARKYEQSASDLLGLMAQDSDADWNDDLKGAAHWLGRATASLSVAYLASSIDDSEHGRITIDEVSTAAANQSTAGPKEDAMTRELQERLRGLVEHLAEPARTLIKKTYFEGLTLQDAAKQLNVSKSWASRLHARTLERLARGLRMMGVCDV